VDLRKTFRPLGVKNYDLQSRRNLYVLFTFVTKYFKTFLFTLNLDHMIKSTRISAGVGMKYSCNLSESRVVVCSTLVPRNQNGALHAHCCSVRLLIYPINTATERNEISLSDIQIVLCTSYVTQGIIRTESTLWVPRNHIQYC